MEHDIIGIVAFSRAGRDKGRSFVVVGIAEDGCVYVSDGETRRLEKPKKKKLKHLSFQKARIPLEQAMQQGDKAVGDAFIRKALAAVQQQPCEGNEEG